MTMRVLPGRAIALAATSSGAAWWLATEGATEAAAEPTLDSLVTAALLVGGAAAALGVAVTTLLALAESALGWRPRAGLALPAPVRRFLVGAAVAAVAGGIAVPATADEAYPGWAPVAEQAADAAPATAVDAAPATPAAGGTTTHVVARGESLWRIAAHLLGPTATDADIARAWPVIYRANRAVIGDDPGLILPGQLLTIPREVAP